MCGIVGYIGGREAAPILLEGLKRLEYRGYDSAGMALVNGGVVDIRRSEGKLAALEELLREKPLEGALGIGHTRWATHGRPSETNAHPHKAGKFALVHNGIIENHRSLREELTSRGHTFKSETDTEIACHLIQQFSYDGMDFVQAVRAAMGRIEGSSAIAVICEDRPDVLICTRVGSPLVLGLGQGENFLASDIPAIMGHTRKVMFLDDGEMAVLDRDGISICDFQGRAVERQPKTVSWAPSMAEKGFYKHFMLKEIHEQPRAVADTLSGRIAAGKGRVDLTDTGVDPEVLRKATRATLVACGTSYHAALVGKFLIEELARLPVEVDLASEFRYRDPLIDEGDLMILISQSGETADTMAALQEGRKKGAYILTVCNVIDSSMARKSDAVLYTHAGPEIGVAATKTFMAQLAAVHLLALHIAQIKNTLHDDDLASHLANLIRAPHYIEEVLGQESRIIELAQKYHRALDFLFLGRGLNYPIALEGALKLKEISYIHAEGYPAGEMKHGPIALIDDRMPVVVLFTPGRHYEKVFSNLEEVKARGGKVIAIAPEGDDAVANKSEDIVHLPQVPYHLTPYLYTIPLQLLAYHIADLRGTDVDQPRNLAKSVTVE